MTSIKTLNGKKKIFTQCPLRVGIQPSCTLCLELRTSSHWLPGCSLLHSHTSASSLQGAVTFQLSPTPPSLVWCCAIDTEMLFCILSRAPVETNTKPSLQKNIPPAFSYACIELRHNILPFWFSKGQNWFRTVFFCHQTCTIIFCVWSKFFTKNSK